MNTRLEHANLQVRNIDAIIDFLQTAFPDFKIRYQNTDSGNDRWVHIGTEDAYLALNSVTREPAENWVPYSGKPGVNHLGFEVDDVESLRTRMINAGYRETTYPNEHPYRKRIYFADPEGNDWEFVQYFSKEPSSRNDYEYRD